MPTTGFVQSKPHNHLCRRYRRDRGVGISVHVQFPLNKTKAPSQKISQSFLMMQSQNTKSLSLYTYTHTHTQVRTHTYSRMHTHTADVHAHTGNLTNQTSDRTPASVPLLPTQPTRKEFLISAGSFPQVQPGQDAGES